MEIVKLIVRVFENKENCEMFSAILEKKWPQLLGENDKARFRAIVNKDQPNVLLVLWEFKDTETHLHIKEVIKKNIEVYLSHLKHKRIDYTGKTLIDFNNLNNAIIHSLRKTSR